MEAESARVLPAKSTNNGVHCVAVRGPDLYPTPPEITKALLKVEALDGPVWEPAAGMGHMANVLIKAGLSVYQTDLFDYGYGNLDQQIDFFQIEKMNPDFSCIVTNPPFSRANEFVRHGLELVPKVIVLARLMFLEGQRRSDILDGHLSRVWVIKERPPFMHRWSQSEDGSWREWTGKKADSAMPFAWYVFEREPQLPTTLGRVSWRD
jgi:hypothetical protein